MDSATARYNRLIAKAEQYHKLALWQEKLRISQEALAICDEPDFPESAARRQELLYDLGAIRRRLGQYPEAERTLHQSLQACPDADHITCANIFGELAVVLRHVGRFEEAREITRQQYILAQDAPPSVSADAEICRAVGNEGMINYNMAELELDPTKRSQLLQAAFMQLRERIERARSLQQRLRAEDPGSGLLFRARSWETIGLDRMALCHIAAGQYPEALAVAQESQGCQSDIEPSITAASRFYYGYALWYNGRETDARKQWNAPSGVCSCPIVFCKEPSQEYNGYLKLMADAEVDFDTYDEQGFTALDYAVLSESTDGQEAIPIVVGAVRKALQKDFIQQDGSDSQSTVKHNLDGEISRRRKQAELRKEYRKLLQETIRPHLRTSDGISFKELRNLYAHFLATSDEQHRVFSDFKYVRYLDFVRHGKLPRSDAGIAKKFEEGVQSGAGEAQNTSGRDMEGVDFIIFISYRWIGGDKPDDSDNTQWKRAKNAAERFLEQHESVRPERLGVWLDYACIDQEHEQEKERGVDGLPLAVLLCNAMISLVDETYYQRAWCGVEVKLTQALIKSYGHHQWWEHRLDFPQTDRSQGSLHEGPTQMDLDVDRLKLTKEVLDRPKIDFLIRQSKLLGRDDA